MTAVVLLLTLSHAPVPFHFARLSHKFAPMINGSKIATGVVGTCTPTSGTGSAADWWVIVTGISSTGVSVDGYRVDGYTNQSSCLARDASVAPPIYQHTAYWCLA